MVHGACLGRRYWTWFPEASSDIPWTSRGRKWHSTMYLYYNVYINRHSHNMIAIQTILITIIYGPRFIPHDVWDDGVACVLLTFFELKNSIAWRSTLGPPRWIQCLYLVTSSRLPLARIPALLWVQMENSWERLRMFWDIHDLIILIAVWSYWYTSYSKLRGRFKGIFGIDCIMQLDVQLMRNVFCLTFVGHTVALAISKGWCYKTKTRWSDLVECHSFLPWLMNSFHDFHARRGSWYTSKHSYMFMWNCGQTLLSTHLDLKPACDTDFVNAIPKLY